jgi:hypothetical protein
MELIAIDSEAPLQETHMSIREMIRKGYRENEAAEAHTTKVSFPRIPQQKWPSSRIDGRFGHHYHLTQVPSEIEVNTQTGFTLVYYILLNFEKPTTAYNSQEITEMTITLSWESYVNLLRHYVTQKMMPGMDSPVFILRGQNWMATPCLRVLASLPWS